jgi:hypothetical protein
MDFQQLVEEISSCLETLSDKGATIDTDIDSSSADIRLTVGGIQYQLYLSGED